MACKESSIWLAEDWKKIKRKLQQNGSDAVCAENPENLPEHYVVISRYAMTPMSMPFFLMQGTHVIETTKNSHYVPTTIMRSMRGIGRPVRNARMTSILRCMLT
jgi:hypothetical protein